MTPATKTSTPSSPPRKRIKSCYATRPKKSASPRWPAVSLPSCSSSILQASPCPCPANASALPKAPTSNSSSRWKSSASASPDLSAKSTASKPTPRATTGCAPSSRPTAKSAAATDPASSVPPAPRPQSKRKSAPRPLHPRSHPLPSRHNVNAERCLLLPLPAKPELTCQLKTDRHYTKKLRTILYQRCSPLLASTHWLSNPNSACPTKPPTPLSSSF